MKRAVLNTNCLTREQVNAIETETLNSWTYEFKNLSQSQIKFTCRRYSRVDVCFEISRGSQGLGEL